MSFIFCVLRLRFAVQKQAWARQNHPIQKKSSLGTSAVLCVNSINYKILPNLGSKVVVWMLYRAFPTPGENRVLFWSFMGSLLLWAVAVCQTTAT